MQNQEQILTTAYSIYILLIRAARGRTSKLLYFLVRMISKVAAGIISAALLIGALIYVFYSPDTGNGVLTGTIAGLILAALLVLYGRAWARHCRGDKAGNDFASQLLDAESQGNQQQKRRPRLHYLDNLKSFLTIIVVMHHCTCALVGSGWYYTVGAYKNSFQIVGNLFLFLNQSYFMAMFFCEWLFYAIIVR